MDFRIGTGYDVHRLTLGYPLFIGGIKIPFEKGSEGHSDGDVLIHAVCDALLGAVNERDIGCHFPDSDPSLKGVDSKVLLAKTMEIVRSKGYECNNIDSVVILETPKLKGYIDKMQEVMAEVMNIDKVKVSVKATTSERLGFTGRGEGVAATASVLVYKK
ncbi:2-C-methyl-D-erythritol 2,4-cyclodiphosphate synthase [Marinilabiliaceae bacterium ANBcel2]|nr:2-C-methyl-D-erythritol 2,4-cyclodiphosphate synthase [Marinilabiliaceae bacterium ANBcel2]